MKTIERLIRKNATEAGTWEPTHYLSLKQARDANPGEYANHFRIATESPVHSKSSDMPWCERCQCWHHTTAEHIRCEESNAGRYYHLRLWQDYLAAKARWKFAHQEHAFCPLPIPRETIKELHDSREAMGRLLHLLRQTPEHKEAFGW